MKKISSEILVSCFLVVIFGFSLSYFNKNTIEFSQNENRFLAQKPSFSLYAMLNGTFEKDFEKYIDDQFVFRENFISLKTNILETCGSKDINGVYIGKDGYFIEKHITINEEQLQKNLKALNQFSSKHKNVELMVVPTASLILKDKLPKNAPDFDQNSVLDAIFESSKASRNIDARNVLFEHNSEYIYYKTDHHWTTLGAFYGYKEYLGSSKVSNTDYNIKTITNDFKGTLYSKILKENKDSIDLFFDKKAIDYVVDFGKEQKNSLYDYDKLNYKDKYQVFFGGNYPEMIIRTNSKSEKSIVIFKDSFANSFIPFLLKDYKNIYVVDLRYFNKDVNEYIKNCNADKTLVLYNVINFSNDKAIEKLAL